MGPEALNPGQVCGGGHDAGVSDIDVEILPDGASLAARAAELVAIRLERAIEVRGWATLAVSGGSTPAGVPGRARRPEAALGGACTCSRWTSGWRPRDPSAT